MESDDETTTDIREMLSLQLSEVEMLGSMYPEEGYFTINPSLLEEIQCFVNGDMEDEDLQSRISFTLKVDMADFDGKVELSVQYSHAYPSAMPEVFVRVSSFSRSQHKHLGDDLQDFIFNIDRGDLCMVLVIEWVQNNFQKYVSMEKKEGSSKSQSKVPEGKWDTFARMWIYSHHIRSKIKRRDILFIAPELHLTGFCMPGKPGMIVTEGYLEHVDDFWHRIRRWNWKKLSMKEKEEYKLEGKDIDEFRKFKNFEEKAFEPRQGKGRPNCHMDFGLLYQMLNEKGCGHIFPLYFGVDGKEIEDKE